MKTLRKPPKLFKNNKILDISFWQMFWHYSKYFFNFLEKCRAKTEDSIFKYNQ
jgi:hypothetical protein